MQDTENIAMKRIKGKSIVAIRKKKIRNFENKNTGKEKKLLQNIYVNNIIL